MAAPITSLFPGDVVMDILARLPVKSLKRFRTVTKSWCSLIESPEFVSTHYSFHKNQECLLVRHNKPCPYQHEYNPEKRPVISCPDKYCLEKMTFFSLCSDQTLDVVGNFEIPSTGNKPFQDWILIQGHCHGIVCFKSYGSINLWNPATKELKTLPACIEDYPQAIAFGYNYKRDDYTVAGILDTYWSFFRFPFGPGSLHLAVYSLATNSWRKFDLVNLTAREVLKIRPDQAIVNGFYHSWVESLDGQELALSFDLSDEVYFTTPLPDGDYGSNCGTRCKHQFMEINGSVGALFTANRTGNIFYDVWMLGEPGEKNSWKKLYTLGPIGFADYPLGVNSNSEFYFAIKSRTGSRLVKYLPSSKETKEYQAEGLGLQLVMYTESLVSLN